MAHTFSHDALYSTTKDLQKLGRANTGGWVTTFLTYQRLYWIGDLN